MQDDNTIHYKLRDSKKRLIYKMAGSLVGMSAGASVIIDGLMHGDTTTVVIGVVLILGGFLLFHHTNGEIDQKIHDLTSGLFGINA